MPLPLSSSWWSTGRCSAPTPASSSWRSPSLLLPGRGRSPSALAPSSGRHCGSPCRCAAWVLALAGTRAAPPSQTSAWTVSRGEGAGWKGSLTHRASWQGLSLPEEQPRPPSQRPSTEPSTSWHAGVVGPIAMAAADSRASTGLWLSPGGTLISASWTQAGLGCRGFRAEADRSPHWHRLPLLPSAITVTCRTTMTSMCSNQEVDGTTGAGSAKGTHCSLI